MEDIKYKNIAIIKLSSLGDIIHTIPAFNILRNVYPNTKISWIVEPEGAELLKNFSGRLRSLLGFQYKQFSASS